MSRWGNLPTGNPTYYPQNIALAQQATVGNGQFIEGWREDAPQHGTIGRFLGSNIEGAQSGFIRCVYTAKYIQNETVTLLCEKEGGCCENGCCPKDQFWMAGVFVLLAFVLLVFILGACLMIICYQRSKNNERREAKEAYEYGYGSQVGMYPGGYASYVGTGEVAPRY